MRPRAKYRMPAPSFDFWHRNKIFYIFVRNQGPRDLRGDDKERELPGLRRLPRRPKGHPQELREAAKQAQGGADGILVGPGGSKPRWDKWNFPDVPI